MVDQKEGETAFAVKVHYDDMVRINCIQTLLFSLLMIIYLLIFQRRVIIRHNKYFYKQIEGTPFSLGLALPEGYGMYALHAEHEIRHAVLNGKCNYKCNYNLKS